MFRQKKNKPVKPKGKSFSMRSKRQGSKGENKRKKLSNLQKTICRSESYHKKKPRNGKITSAGNYTSGLCKSSNNIQEKLNVGASKQRSYIPMIRECGCNRKHHRHGHGHEKIHNSRSSTSQTYKSHGGKSSVNKIPYVSPANRNTTSSSFLAGRKLIKSKNGQSKCSISQKYVGLAESRIGKTRIKTTINNEMNNLRGGSFDNRNKTGDISRPQNASKADISVSSREKINQGENIMIENNYGQKTRFALKMVENNFNLSGVQDLDQSIPEKRMNNTLKKAKTSFK